MEKTEKIKAMKGKEKITMLTAYDAVTAELLGSCGIDIILVGDSVANVLLGYEDTQSISMNEMLHHVSAVCRVKPNALVVADMPIGSYSNPKIALENAEKFMGAGAGAVKLEGAFIAAVLKLVQNNIPVMGHVGLLPQSMKPKVQGKEQAEAEKIISDAKVLSDSGCFSIVIEAVPSALGKKITESVSVPTIGIGAGPDCDGQVLVINDLVNFNASDFKPKFVKQYANLKEEFLSAVKAYRKDVKSGKFPGKEFCYK